MKVKAEVDISKFKKTFSKHLKEMGVKRNQLRELETEFGEAAYKYDEAMDILKRAIDSLSELV